MQQRPINPKNNETGQCRDALEKPLESHQMMRLILDIIPVRVYWKDRHLSYMECNQAFALDA